MLISCKCLNFVVNAQNSTPATVIQGTVNTNNGSEQEQQQQQQNLQQNHHHHQNDDKNDFSKIERDLKNISELYGINIEEIQKLQKSSNQIYEKCLEFFRQSTGPLNNLQENIVQKDLVYKVPIKPWILYYCINCDTIAYAKHTSNNMIYIIDMTLLKNQEELNYLKNHQTYSETFGILIMDYPKLKIFMKDNIMMDTLTTTSGRILTSSKSSSSSSSSSLSSSSSPSILINKEKQIRLKNLTDILNNRLQKEIYDTDERIRRYTEQQFALLKSFREKSEQEYQILVSLINYVPDELKINDAIDNNIIMNNDRNNDVDNNINDDNGTIKSKITTGTTTKINNITGTTAATTTTKGTSSTSLFTLKQQQILNLDTPPATPDSTPMSVGNSPTFRQQQQQQQQQANIFGDDGGSINGRINQKMNIIGDAGINGGGGGGYNNDYNAMIISYDADCLFELEGMETMPDTRMNTTDMSDLEDAEDGEDALGELETTAVQIPRSNSKKSNSNIAKSLPISILNVPERKFYINDLDDEIPEDSNIDIAASIKALAKSVHGDTVFGDLPRPRFSTQI